VSSKAPAPGVARQQKGPAAPARPAGPHRSAEPPILRLQQAAGNRATARLIAQEFEAPLNADFSDVDVVEGSGEAARLGALAFTRGSDVHFAPGQFRPHAARGRELIGHELAHVVQQRQGRAAPAVQMKGGVQANLAPALEADADRQGRLAARGLAARPGGAFSAPAQPDEPVVQGVFTVAATIVLADSEAPSVPAAQMLVTKVQMSEKRRPPTRLEGSQGRHIIAWTAKVQYWQTLFKQKTYAAAFAQLEALAKSDQGVDEQTGKAPGAVTLRAELLDRLAELRTTERASESSWISNLQWALTTYVKAYQLSSFSAFESKRPIGKGEAYNIAFLTGVQKTAARERRLEAATGLVDLNAGLAPVVQAKVFQDWLNLVNELAPGLIKESDKDAMDRLAASDKPDASASASEWYHYFQALVKTVIGGAPEPEVVVAPVAPKKRKGKGKEAPAKKAKKGDIEAEEDIQSSADDPDVMEAESLRELNEREPFLVTVDSTVTGGSTYPAGDLQVKRLSVSDERPPTMFGTRQMSHTIPWSMAKLSWIKRFGGPNSLTEVMGTLFKLLEDDDAWPTAATVDWVVKGRIQLTKEIKTELTNKQTISAWTSWLNHTIERYVALYQASPFAAYATEPTESGGSTAIGRGEGPALKQFAAWEEDPPKPDATKLNRAVVETAKKLIDVPGLTLNRKAVDVGRLGERWLDDLAVLFPSVFEAFELEFEVAFEEAQERTEKQLELDELLMPPEPGTSRRSKRVAGRKGDPGTSRPIARRPVASKLGGRKPALIRLSKAQARKWLDNQRERRAALLGADE
jgi:hypothetical protein